MTSTTSEKTPLARRLLFGTANWALLLSGLANLGIGTLAAFQDSATIAATSLTAGLVLLFAGTIDRFESLKGLGIEAKTRQLDQKIVQADDALRQLRQMTEITGAALIDLSSKMGRWGAVPGPRESIALADRVRQTMKNLGSGDDVINTALYPWAETLCFDIAQASVKGMRELLRLRVSELEAERRKIKQPIYSGSADFIHFNQLSVQINAIHNFQESRLKNLHLLKLEDYPNRLMELFDAVPEIDPLKVEELRKDAARFVPGMTSLRDSRTLPDQELWIETIRKQPDQ